MSFVFTKHDILPGRTISKCFRLLHSALPASVPRYSQGSNRSDTVTMPVDVALWRSDQLEVFPNKSQSERVS